MVGRELIVLSDGLIRASYLRLTGTYLKNSKSKAVFKLSDMRITKRLDERALCLLYIPKT